jgi:hypothetical protein
LPGWLGRLDVEYDFEAIGVTSKERHDALRSILNSWDPVGVADVALDEYDCLHGPRVQFLGAGRDHQELASYLREQLASHFGLDRSSPGTDEAAREILAWWSDEGAQDGHGVDG